MMYQLELNNPLIQDKTVSYQTMPAHYPLDDRLQRFLEQAGFTDEDLAEVGITQPELLLALLTPS